MLVTLTARGFRNLQPTIWSPCSGRNVLLGENGAGKSSLLEAIYLLSSTKSFRTSQISDCCQKGSDQFELKAEVESQSRSTLFFHWSNDRRLRHLNGRQAALAEHLAALPLVVWTAQDAEALTGEPRHRRRLLDRGLVGQTPAALGSLSRYKRALAAKRAELLSGGAALAAWNEILAHSAAEVIGLRRSYHDKIRQEFGTVLAESGLALPDVTLEYRPSPQEGGEGASAIEKALAKAADQERRRREALIGPHRDDWILRLRNADLKRIASAGERRALGILLAVAHGRLLQHAGQEAIGLFDDMDAELSQTTLKAVWATLRSSPQIIATSSRPRVWQELEIDHRWTLLEGTISKP